MSWKNFSEKLSLDDVPSNLLRGKCTKYYDNNDIIFDFPPNEIVK